jgi:D-inositol-3-phosphate glycosyltransferase
MKKRIAFISEHASPLAILGGVDNGGQNVYVAELSKELAKAGYAVDIFTRRDNASQPPIVDWLPNVRVIHIKAGPDVFVEKEGLLPYMHEFADNMLSFINSWQWHYDLIHANFFMSALVASIVKRVLQIPYVVTFHALGLVRLAHQKEKDRFPKERFDIEKYIVDDADQIIAECPQDRDDLIYYYDADPSKVTIIPCGFNPKEFCPIDSMTARKKLQLKKEEKILLQLGRIVPRKGIDNVIRAAGRLKNKISNLRLVVVGGDTDTPDPAATPEFARLRKIAEEENVTAQVTFTGRKSRDELRYYYAAADVFITTPWYEPFGITPLEAMACGTPVIGANVGGIKFSVEDGKTGFLVPPNDPDALADRISKLFADNKLQTYMRMNAVKRVNKYFTWTRVAVMVNRLYETVLADRQHEPALCIKLLRMENFSIKEAIRSMMPESFYPVLNV